MKEKLFQNYILFQLSMQNFKNRGSNLIQNCLEIRSFTDHSEIIEITNH